MALRVKKKAQEPTSASDKGEVYSLTLRLRAESYRRLRNYVTTHEQKTGERLSHQGIIDHALAEYLAKVGGSDDPHRQERR